MGYLGAIYLTGLIVATVIVVVVCVVGGLILAKALRAIHAAGPDAQPPSRTARVISTALAIGATAIAASPIVATLASAPLGPDALPSDTGTVAAIAAGLGVLSVSAAWLERLGPARHAAGGLLIVVVLVPAAIQVWVTSQTVAYATAYQDRQDAAERRAIRYADLADGPTAGEIVAAVGNVGSWRALSGDTYPHVRYEEWLRDQGPVADLSGRTVRLAVLGQCWIDGDPGEFVVGVTTFDDQPSLDARFGRCDGSLQVWVSDAVALPAWPSDRLTQARDRDRDLLGVVVLPDPVTGLTGEIETAVRYVVYISPDPASPVAALVDAVRSAAGSFDIR